MSDPILTREELHRLVWSEPGTQAAKKLGISDVALAKRCKREGIPRPPRGYWAKIAAGQTPHTIPLPPPPVRPPKISNVRKAPPKVEPPIPPPKPARRRNRSRIARNDRLESFWCKIESWKRSYRFGVNWRPWELNEESWSEYDDLQIESSIRSKTNRPYQHLIIRLLPTYARREEFRSDLRAIGNVWTDRTRKRTLFCSAFVPHEVFHSLCIPSVHDELVEAYVEVLNLARGHGSTSSVSFEPTLTDLSDED